jgi:tetratricopeptide (TPR) repeat protein
MQRKRADEIRRRKQQGNQSPPEGLVETARGLLEAERLRKERKLEKARKICGGLLSRYPGFVGAHHEMGLILADMHNYSQALTHLVQASMHDPDNWKTLTAMSGVYLRLGASVMAARTLERADQLNPGDAGILITLGEIYREDREYELGAETFRKAISAVGTGPAALYGLGLCLLELGEFEEAAQVFERLVASGFRSVTTLNALSEVPARFVSSDLLALIDVAGRMPDQTQDYFDAARRFTRAAALHNAGRHAEAWADLVDANAAIAPSVAQEWSQLAGTQRIILDGARAATIKISAAQATDQYPVSLFILGVSRSGKTVAERLIATLRGVKPGYENPIVERTVQTVFHQAGLPSRQRPIELPPLLDGEWRKVYLAELARRAGDARVFTNTNPGLIESALRIAAVIPNARFILVKRDAADTALRIFMKKYRAGNPYAYDLNHVRSQIDWYHQMIDVLADKAPGVVRVVRYEDIVCEPAALLRATCELCSLPWFPESVPQPADDRGCAAPYRTFMANV